MKKLLLSLICGAFSLAALSQVTIFQEDFDGNGGAGSNWAVIDVPTPGMPQGDMPNIWYNSDLESGEPAGNCGTAGTGDNSLHISSTSLGDLGAAYDAGGLCGIFWCTFADRRSYSNDINTVGITGMTLNFNYIENGEGNDDNAIVEYSVNGGASWLTLDDPVKPPLGGCAPQGTWTAYSFALPPACENIANLRIAFRWWNDDDGIGTDPSFAVDDISITTAGGGVNTITTQNNVLPATWCFGSTITGTVNFDATGTYNAGNIYTAELSDATGSFAAPTAVGTLASSANGSLSITTTILGTTPVGAGYRIRVVSSDPPTTGTDNISDLVINPLPNVTLSQLTDVCEDASTFALSGGSPAGGSYSGPGVSAGQFNPAVAGAGTHTITYSYTDGNGCAGTDAQTITVNPLPNVALAQFSDVCDYTPIFTLTGGTPAGGTYSGTGVAGGQFNPSVAGLGTFTITYTYTDINGCTSWDSQTIHVDACLSVLPIENGSFTVFPNPTKKYFTIEGMTEIDKVVLTDLKGRIILTFDESADSYNIQDIVDGVYMLHIVSGLDTYMTRLIKQ